MEPTTSITPAAQVVEKLLISDIFFPMTEVEKYRADVFLHPEKATDYSKHLAKILMCHSNEAKKTEKNKMKDLVVQRVEEWEKTYRPLSISEKAMLCCQWNVSIEDVINQRMTPALIKEMLDVFIIGQDDYKKQLSKAFFIYLMKKKSNSSVMELPRGNLLVCGPSGTGKTYGVQKLSELFDVPFILIHSNGLVQEGIKGPSIPGYFTTLYQRNGSSIKNMECAIGCFDEFDKLYEEGYYNLRIINEILNIIDEKGEVRFHEYPDNSGEELTVPTKNMMFIFTGVFKGLDKFINGQSLGFHDTNKKSHDNAITPEALLLFGIKPEIVGRIQNYTMLSDFTEQELIAIMDSPLSSPYNKIQNLFLLSGIEAELDKEAKETIAKLACERHLGVRGIEGLFQRVLDKLLDLELLEGEKLIITKDYIEQCI